MNLSTVTGKTSIASYEDKPGCSFHYSNWPDDFSEISTNIS